MSAKSRKQCCWEIRMEMQILPEFWQAQEFCAFICAAEPERCFTPVLDLERRINLLVDDISSVIIVNDLHILQIPGFGFRAVGSATCHVVCDDIVVRVLLKDLNVVERVAPRKEILNKPSAQIGSIAKNLPLDVTTGTGLRFRKK